MDLEVDETHAGMRLDAFLALHHESRSEAAKAISEGRVLLDGLPAKKSHLVEAGSRVAVVDPPELEPETDELKADIPIIFQDEHILIIDKPAGLVVHPAPGHRTGTLSQILAPLIAGGEEGRQGVVHRLDRDTTGLLILARTDEAHRRLRVMIDERAVTREYTAAVLGHPPTAEGTIDAPIGRDRKRRTRVSTSTDVPREAVTHFSVVETMPDHTLLQVRLETGRTHQIRAHLASISLRVVGDPEYGPSGPAPLGLSRQFLHASRLAFEHPITGEEVEFESQLPKDLASVLEVLRGKRAD